jgi:trimethylamine---corrinoid protein Co-methyltransferase
MNDNRDNLSTAARIDEASLELLEDPGVRIEHDVIYAMLLQAGGQPGNDAQVVRLPRPMVREYVALAPKRFALTDRRGRGTTLSAASEPLYWSCPGMGLWRDGKHRVFRSTDMADIARLMEHLPNVHAVFGMAMDDVPPAARDIAGLNLIAQNCSKHIRVLCFSPAGAKMMTEIKPVIGNHAWFSIGFTAHGPLRWTHLALEIFRLTAGHGIPTSINGEPMAGVSGPVTLAGSGAVGNAEILAGIVINQVLEPGRPCLYNLGLAHIFDMRTAVAVTGGPENALFAEMAAQMGRFYNLPSASWVSTESMCPDSQAALEKMLGFQTHAAAGVSCIWGVGQLESEMTISPAQAVIDNEMISFAKRFQRGYDASDASLALDVTRNVGIAGSFLDHDHTLEHFRKEFFEPGLLWRRRRQDWTDTGGKRLDERAEEAARELIARPVDNSMSEDQAKALIAMAEEFVGRQVGVHEDRV